MSASELLGGDNQARLKELAQGMPLDSLSSAGLGNTIFVQSFLGDDELDARSTESTLKNLSSEDPVCLLLRLSHRSEHQH